MRILVTGGAGFIGSNLAHQLALDGHEVAVVDALTADPQSLSAAQLAVKTFTPQPQPEEAIAVKAPPGGWDGTQANAAKLKPRPLAAAAPAPRAPVEAKAN